MPDEIARIRDLETHHGVYHFIVPWTGYGYGQDRFALPPDPPAYWSPARDDVLRATIYRESAWDTAVAIAIAKMVSQAWEVEGEVPLRVRRAQDLLLATPWVRFISMQVRDYLLTDNGCFFGLERASRARGAKIVGLYHLDSRRCTRTGDADVPVLYRDRLGGEHELKDYQVVMLSDEPDPSEMWNGIGHCAGARAYHKVYKLASIETFVSEKVSGRRPLAVHLVNGITSKQLDDAIASAQQQAAQKGTQVYMGAVIAALMGDVAPQLVTIPLAEIPTGFDPALERKDAQLTYANALGLDPQDINPDLLASRAMGTGAQSQVIDDKARGKTLSVFRQAYTHALNEFVFPDTVSMHFVENDLRDQKQLADVQTGRAGVLSSYVTMGAITPEQALQVAVDADDLPREFLVQDVTAGETLSDTERPLALPGGVELPDVPPLESEIGGLPDVPPLASEGAGLPDVPRLRSEKTVRVRYKANDRGELWAVAPRARPAREREIDVLLALLGELRRARNGSKAE